MKDKFIRMFADEVPLSILNDTDLKLYKELGMTEIAPPDMPPESIDDIMAAVSRSGMTIMPGLFGCLPGNDDKFHAYCKDIDFKKYPAFTGFYVYDEPSAILFDWLKKERVDWYNENYSDSSYWHINLLPSYAGYTHLRTTDSGDYDEGTYYTAYENYIGQYAEKVLKHVRGRKGIGMDNYALRANGKYKYLLDSYLYDMAVVAVTARDNGLIFCNSGLDSTVSISTASERDESLFFHNCIQCYIDGNSYDIRPITSVAEIRFQLYASMAMGAKLLEFYCYMSRGKMTGIVDENNKPNEMYYCVKEAISEIKKFDAVYMNFSWEGFVTVNGTNNGEHYMKPDFAKVWRLVLKKLCGIKSVSATEDTLIGQLKNGNTTGYIILNYNEPSSEITDKVKLEFDDDITEITVYRNGVRMQIKTFGKAVELLLASGEGVFVVSEKKEGRE